MAEQLDIVITEQGGQSGSGPSGAGSHGGILTQPIPPAGGKGLIVIDAQTVVLNSPIAPAGGNGQNPGEKKQNPEKTPMIDTVTSVFGDGAKYVKAFGAAMGDLAKNNVVGAFTKGIDAAASAVEKIPAVGQAIGAGLRFAAAGIEAIEAAKQESIARGRELAPYSGRIAAAAANADVTQMRLDMKEAQQVGDEYARLIEAEAQTRKDNQELFGWLQKIRVDIQAGLEEQDHQWRRAVGLVGADAKVPLSILGEWKADLERSKKQEAFNEKAEQAIKQMKDYFAQAFNQSYFGFRFGGG